ncbi:sigma-54 dependent transcriptional regulator [Pendulispora rubella]|uniref:Sigma-54 dependent transcriptional regulator n=2 Tax=Pendulispora rubella TaxID=2741070 RepID=A0ABZ2KXQ1_9BACT
MVQRLAASQTTVLIHGESGSGKTHLARAIHEASPRARSKLLVVNCAAIPASLIENELFGHERGAFTGAVNTQEGAFEAAGDGTLLLDEIGELPLGCQAKLLRALEERAFERIGSRQTRMLRARILVATNRDLEAMLVDATFRKDLYFRISTVQLRVPSLRERGGDVIASLAEQLLREAARAADRQIIGFSPRAIEAIQSYTWPGNIRELRNAIEHAAVLGRGLSIEFDELPAAVREGNAETTALRESAASNTDTGPISASQQYFAARDEALARFERNYLAGLIRDHGSRVADAARASGLSRVHLYRLFRKHGLKPRMEAYADSKFGFASRPHTLRENRVRGGRPRKS